MTEPGDPPRRPVLVSVGGLPATGKTTVCRLLAARLRAAYVRVDTIETAVARAEGRHSSANVWELPPGYLVGYEVVADQLGLGLDVVAESVNPIAGSRDAWLDVGRRSGARVVEVEVVCSDPVEHRRRLETRVLDVDGLANPTWRQVEEREYHPWDRDRLVVDTASRTADEAVADVLGVVRG